MYIMYNNESSVYTVKGLFVLVATNQIYSS